jgi:hypothetical protein
LIKKSGYATFMSMEVEVIPGVRVHAELEQELYTLRLIGNHSRYEFCAEDELPSALALLCEVDRNDPMVRRRVLLSVDRIVNER